jgi:hypothetical protein
MKIVREEIFGPVVVMSSFDTEDEVIAAANDSIYGLASAVFTQDINRAHRVTNKLKVCPSLHSLAVGAKTGRKFEIFYFSFHPFPPSTLAIIISPFGRLIE